MRERLCFEEKMMKFQRISMMVVAAALCCSPLLAQDGMGTPVNNNGQEPGGRNSGIPTAVQDPMGGTAADPAMLDKMFLKKAAAGGMFEVQAGQVAAQKGNSDAVRDFGKQMVADHIKLNQDMEPIARKFNVGPPEKLEKKDQAELDKLNSLTGTDFDKEYITCMVMDHRKDQHEFRMEAANATDPELKTGVANGEKMIHHHLMMIEQIAKDQNVDVPSEHRSKPPMPPSVQ
jgi:putative membrane protein